MIELLLLGKREGWQRLKQAVEEVLGLGASDAAAVRHLMAARELTRPTEGLAELGQLQRYERPLPKIDEYDRLLSVTDTLAEVAPLNSKPKRRLSNMPA